MKVLVFSSVLPSLAKPKANDILLMSATKHSVYRSDVNYKFILLIPYSNWLLSKISEKWKSYYELRQSGQYVHSGHNISVIAIPMFGTNLLVNLILVKIGFLINKSKLMSIIRNFDPDIVHAHNVLIDSYIANKLYERFKIPFVITDRSIYKYFNSRKVVGWMTNAKAIISVNYRYKNISEKIVGKDKSYLIPHGIDEYFFDYNAARKNASPKLITICGLWQLKNIDKVLYALNNIRGDFEYHIYGDGPDYDRLVGELDKLAIKGKVKFKGGIEHKNVPNTLVDYDVFVMPSYPENFGRVFVEAMAVGLPVVGAKGAGIDGYIQNGVSGFLVDHQNISELQNVLHGLLKNKDLREEVGMKGKDIAYKFTWSSVINQLDAVYNKALHN